MSEEKLEQTGINTSFTNKDIIRNNELDLFELFLVLWTKKHVILVSITLCLIIGVIYSISLPNMYQSTVLLSPLNTTSEGGQGGIAGRLGGLASLAGVNLGGGSNDLNKTVEIIKSKGFISSFVREHDLMIPLLAAKAWDANSGELLLDSEVFNEETSTWYWKGIKNGVAEPSDWDIYRKFKKIFVISIDEESGFVTIGITHYSPVLTKEWVDLLVKQINENMKSKAIKDAQSSIQYLLSQLNKTNISDMKNVFFELIEEQTKRSMLAEVKPEFAFSTIDPASIPDTKIGPMRFVICMWAAFLGFVLGCACAFIMHMRAKNKFI
jgi:uncharacterized protein involved in exopolysaccharide biosynthesis